MTERMNDDLTAEERRRAWWILAVNTFAFTVCFAAWMMNGVLITFLVHNGVHDWTPSEMGWLIGIPVLTVRCFACHWAWQLTSGVDTSCTGCC